MKCNVGRIDRGLRITVGLVLVVLAASNVVSLWGWIGLVPLATGLFKFCPLYPIFGMNSCGVGKENCSK